MIPLNDCINYAITEEEFQQVMEGATKKYSAENARGQITKLRNKITQYRENVDRVDAALIRDLYWLRCLSKEQIETYYYSKAEVEERLEKLMKIGAIERVSSAYKGEAYQLKVGDGYRYFKYSYRIFSHYPPDQCHIKTHTMVQFTSKRGIERQLKTNELALKVKRRFLIADQGDGYGYQLLYNYSRLTWYQDAFHYGGYLKKVGVSGVLRLFGDYYLFVPIHIHLTPEQRLKQLLLLRDQLANQHRKIPFITLFIYEETPTAVELRFFNQNLKKAGFCKRDAVILNQDRLIQYLEAEHDDSI